MSLTRFGIVPCAVFDRGLDPAEIAVLALLSTYVDATGWCAPGSQAIADKLRRSRPWAVAAVGKLEAAGVLQVDRSVAPTRLRLVYDCQPADTAPVSRLTPPSQPIDTSRAQKPQRPSAVDDLECQPADAARKRPLSIRKKPVVGKESRPGKTHLSAGWRPDAELHAWATARRPDLDLEETIDNFRDYWIGHGKQMASWPATFRTWVKRERQNGSGGRNGIGGQQSGAPGPHGPSPDERLRSAAIRAVAPRMGPSH